MAALEAEIQSPPTSKDQIRQVAEEQYRQMGIPTKPTVTIAELRRMVAEDLRASGIPLESCDASQAIIAARDNY